MSQRPAHSHTYTKRILHKQTHTPCPSSISKLCTHTHTCTNAHTHTLPKLFIRAPYTHTCTHTHTPCLSSTSELCTHTNTHTLTCTHKRTHTHTLLKLHIRARYTESHTHMHTHTHTRAACARTHLAQAPHQSSVHTHQLLLVYRVSLVKHNAHFVVLPTHGCDDLRVLDGNWQIISI